MYHGVLAKATLLPVLFFSVPPCRTGASLPERIVKNTLLKIPNKKILKILSISCFLKLYLQLLYLSGEAIAVPLTARKSDLMRFGPH